MNDNTIIQLCKKVHQWSSACVPDDEFTAWIRAIREASILELHPEDAWIEDAAVIQVRRMWEQDLLVDSMVDIINLLFNLKLKVLHYSCFLSSYKFYSIFHCQSFSLP